MINANVAVFIDDDKRIGIGRIMQQTVEQRGLAAAQKTGDHRYADALIIFHVGRSDGGRLGLRAKSAKTDWRKTKRATHLREWP
ncbi:hypothetical protein D3C86_1822580 [compost metagenome]